MADVAGSPRLQPSDLETPTLKKPIVTTGRGGTGNMAKATDSKEARHLQDVDAVVRRPSQGTQHAGRGGAGNIFKESEKKELQNKAGDSAVDDSHDYDSGAADNSGEKEEEAKDDGFVAKLKNGILGRRSNS